MSRLQNRLFGPYPSSFSTNRDNYWPSNELESVLNYPIFRFGPYSPTGSLGCFFRLIFSGKKPAGPAPENLSLLYRFCLSTRSPSTKCSRQRRWLHCPWQGHPVVAPSRRTSLHQREIASRSVTTHADRRSSVFLPTLWSLYKRVGRRRGPRPPGLVL